MSFVHTHVHSEHSMLDGISKAKDLAKRAKELGQTALALTDHGNLFGAVEFYEACISEEIKPIIGVELYVAPGDRREKPLKTSTGGPDSEVTTEARYFHLIALAKDLEGYRNLLRLVSEAEATGFYYKARVDREILEQYKDGLIILSGCLGSQLAQAILKGDTEKAIESIAWHKQTFGGSFFIEVQDHGQDEDKIYNAEAIRLAREMDVPIVASGDSHYTLKEDAHTAQISHCIATRSTLAAPKFSLTPFGAYAIKSEEEMRALGFPEDAYTNTQVIADRCNLKLDLGARLPFPNLDHVTGGRNPMAYLKQQCLESMDIKFPGRVDQVYDERLAYELSVIETTGFAEYILLVWDFVRWAREQGIPAVPRGSAAGSLILHLLGVSDIDPIEFGLTFERFLNPERVQMPDVDMDFADEHRQKVLDYCVERYGQDHVAQMSTFSKMQARSAIKDVGGVLGHSPTETAKIANLVPKLPVGTKISEALEKVAELKAAYADPHYRVLLDLAMKIEGTIRQSGVHAAGVVISGDPLVMHTPVQPLERGKPALITQYPQHALEVLGLLKMDFLGLANLSMLARGVKLIHDHRGVDIEVRDLPDKDEKTFAMLSRGETTTVFQVEGSGLTRYLKELQPTEVRHLAAMVALYRPGPMEHIPHYIARRHGREPVTYLHPDLEPILSETFGVLVYQDQVLLILQKIAGYTLGQADIVRRAMGKKIASLMAEEKDKFLAGATAKGYSDIADELWSWIEPHASYSFNKAHATAYGILAYQTAYLKANYPLEWMAAVFQAESLKTDRIPPLLAECRRIGMVILPPDVNTSFCRFSIEALPPGPHGGRGIRFGLGSVKGVGEPAAEAIVEEREVHGPYRSLSEMCSRVNLRVVTRGVLESLVKAGALDCFAPREQLLGVIDEAIKAARKWQKKADGPCPELDPIPMTPFTLAEVLAWEQEAMGLFLLDHPFATVTGQIDGTMSTKDLEEVEPGNSVTIAGAVTVVKAIITKKNERMAIVTLEDLDGSIEVVVFPRAFARTEDLWQLGHVVITSGKLEVKDDKPQIIVEQTTRWQDSLRKNERSYLHSESRYVRGFTLDEEEHMTELAIRIMSDGDVMHLMRDMASVGKLIQQPGETPVRVLIEQGDGTRTRLDTIHPSICFTPALREQLEALLGKENVLVRA